MIRNTVEKPETGPHHRSTAGEGIEIRTAVCEDDAALRALARSCPMSGKISLSIEREPGFFLLAGARGASRIYVAEVNGELVGCGAVARRSAYLAGQVTDIGYVCDVKVLPQWRGRGLARLLLQALSAGEKSEPAAAYSGTVAAGNVAVERLLSRLPGPCAVAPAGRITSYQLFPNTSRRVGGESSVTPAEARDEDELSALLDTYYRRRNLAPVFADGGLRRIIDSSPGMSLHSYLLVRQGARIMAAAALWDPTQLKQTRVNRLPRRLRWAGLMSRRLAPQLRLPRLPLEGELLQHAYVRHPAYVPEGRPALAAILRWAAHRAAAAGWQFVVFTCADGDPVQLCVRGLPRVGYHYTVMAGAFSSESARKLPLLRCGLLYDDPALA